MKRFLRILLPTLLVAVSASPLMGVGVASAATPTSLTTGAASSIGATTATLNGSITPGTGGISGSHNYDMYFCYSTSNGSVTSNSTCESIKVAASPSSVTASNSSTSESLGLTGLSAGTKYYYEIVAEDSFSQSQLRVRRQFHDQFTHDPRRHLHQRLGNSSAAQPDRLVTYPTSTFNAVATATAGDAGGITYAVTSANGTGCSVNASTGAVSTITSVGTGPCVITATVAASGSYAAGSSTLSITVAKATPTVTFTNGSVTPAPPSQTASVTYPTSTFNAVATSSGTGTVTYAVNNANGTGCSVNSSGAVTGMTSIGTGPCVITASVAANGNYAAGSSNLSITVNGETPTITFTNGSTTPAPPNQTANATFGNTFNAVATSNSGATVTYSSGTSPCTISGTTVTFTGIGTCTITASVGPNGVYAGGGFNSRDYRQCRNAHCHLHQRHRHRPNQTASCHLPTSTFNAVATATTGDSGAITYAVTSANGTGCSVNASNGAVSTFTSVGTGPCVITATVAANGNYAAGSSTLSITVNGSTPTVTFTNGTRHRAQPDRLCHLRQHL